MSDSRDSLASAYEQRDDLWLCSTCGHTFGEHSIGSQKATRCQRSACECEWFTRAVHVAAGSRLATPPTPEPVAWALVDAEGDVNCAYRAGIKDQAEVDAESLNADRSVEDAHLRPFTVQPLYLGASETAKAISDVWAKHWPSFSLVKKASWDELDAAIRADERAKCRAVSLPAPHSGTPENGT